MAFWVPVLMLGEYLALRRLVMRVEGQWQAYGAELLVDARRRIEIMALAVPLVFIGRQLEYACSHICWGVAVCLHLFILLAGLLSVLAEAHRVAWQFLVWTLVPQPYLMAVSTALFLAPSMSVRARRLVFACFLLFALLRCVGVRCPAPKTRMDVILRGWWRYPWLLAALLCGIGIAVAQRMYPAEGVAVAVGLIVVYQEVETVAVLKKRGWM